MVGGGKEVDGLMSGRCGVWRCGAGRVGGVLVGVVPGSIGVMSVGFSSVRFCGGNMFWFSGFRSPRGVGRLSMRGSFLLFRPPGLGVVSGRFDPGTASRLAPGTVAGGRSDTCGRLSGVIGGEFGLRGVSLRLVEVFGVWGVRTSSPGIV